MVVHGGRERHEQRRCADGRDFGDGAGTGARDDQVGVGIGPRGVVDEGRQFAVDAGGGIVGAQLVDLLGAALVRDLRPFGRRDQGQRLRHHGVERLGAEAAADHQQLAADRCGPRSAPPDRAATVKAARNGLPIHCAFLSTFGNAVKTRSATLASTLLAKPGDRVLFVQHQRLAEQHAHHAARKGDVAAQADHHVGLARGARRAMLCQKARSRRIGSSASVSGPLPRTPPNCTGSKAKPRGGTSLLLPCCRARRASARASRARAGPRPRPGPGRCVRRCRRP